MGKFCVDFFSGMRFSLLSLIGTSCLFPVDMVKTRLQSDQSTGKYKGIIDCFRKIYQTEGGVRAFYRGLAPNLVGVIPEKAIKLVRIRNTSTYLCHHRDSLNFLNLLSIQSANEVLRERFEKEDGSIELIHEVISGAGAGFVQVTQIIIICLDQEFVLSNTYIENPSETSLIMLYAVYSS